MNTNRPAILGEIIQERFRQAVKFPRQEPGCKDVKDDDFMLAVLAEEFGEVARAILEGDESGRDQELIDVAAVCVKWLEIRGRTGKGRD